MTVIGTRPSSECQFMWNPPEHGLPAMCKRFKPLCEESCLRLVVRRYEPSSLVVLIAMTAFAPVYRCRSCGSTNYQRLTHRGPDGVMQYSGAYRCSGCRAEFSDLESWRERRLRARVSNIDAAESPHVTGAPPEPPSETQD